MVRYNGLVWSNIAVPVLLPSYIYDHCTGLTSFLFVGAPGEVLSYLLITLHIKLGTHRKVVRDGDKLEKLMALHQVFVLKDITKDSYLKGR